MKALHVTSEFGRVYKGGLGTFVTALATEQSKAIDVDVLLATEEQARFKPVGDQMVDAPARRGWSAFVENRIEQYDIIHFHDWHGHWVIDHIDCSFENILFTSHLPSVFEGYDKVVADYHARFCGEKKIIRRSKYVVANSRFTLSQMFVKHRFSKNKGLFIHNGCDGAKFKPPSVERRKFEAVAAGRIVEQKGIQTFVDAVSLILEVEPESNFAIAGDGELTASLKARAKALGISSKLNFLGQVSQDELAELFRSSRIVAVPSIYEPFGMVAIEAMASGASIVASDTGGLREIVEHGHNGLLVEVGDKYSLAGAVLHLLKNDSAWDTLRQRGVQCVIDKFSISRCSSEYIDLYHDICGCRKKNKSSP